jgi:tRNA uridine 5-carboxymethylaminomethyl modification enzyme
LQRNDLNAHAVWDLAPLVAVGLSREEKTILETRIRYEGYIRRERERLERLRPFESRVIPSDFDYEGIPGLSREAVEKCSQRRPRTLGEASRIPGMTPAAVAIISVHVARGGGSSPL